MITFDTIKYAHKFGNAYETMVEHLWAQFTLK